MFSEEQEAADGEWAAQQIQSLLSAGRTSEAVQATLALSGENISAPLSLPLSAALELYNIFVVDSVEVYYDELQKILSGDAKRVLEEVLGTRIAMTRTWKKRMEEMFIERRARDIHAAVRAHDQTGAEAICVELLSRESSEEGRRRMAALIGNVFGTLETEQGEVSKVLSRLPGQYRALGLSSEMFSITEKTMKERLALLYKSQQDHRAQDWNRALAAAVSTLKGSLPSVMVFGQADGEAREGFADALRSIIRCRYYQQGGAAWEDILDLLVEICPREVSQTGAAAGVETRLYNLLTPAQKRTIIEVMVELGENDSLTGDIMAFARNAAGARHGQYAVEVLGGMKAEGAFGFFLEMLKARPSLALRRALIAAMGSLAAPQARAVLVKLLDSAMKGSPVTPQRRQLGEELLLGLAKASRNKALLSEERNGLIRDVIEILGMKDARLNVLFGENFFLVRQEEINAAYRSWAAERLAEGLWLKDTAATFARGPRAGEGGGRTHLGFREGIVNALERLGAEFLPVIINVAEQRIIHYCGAYMAIGEIMGRIGDARAVPLLDKLLSAALLADDGALGKYEQEEYWNAAGETKERLDRDMIASSLAYALNKIGGEKADAVIEEYFQAFQSGRYQSPGTATMEILFKAHQRIQSEKSVEDKDESLEAQGSDTQGTVEDVEGAIHDLTRGYFLTGAEKKRLAKIRALQTLGRAREARAIAIAADHLADKDPMVAGAAATCLLDYNMPPMPVETLHMYLHEIVSRMLKAKPDVKRKMEEILRKLGPERDVMRDRIRAAVEMETHPTLRFSMEKIFAAQLAPMPGAPPGEVADNKSAAGMKRGPVSELEARRRFMQARREWIAGGKKGDPPKLEDYTS